MRHLFEPSMACLPHSSFLKNRKRINAWASPYSPPIRPPICPHLFGGVAAGRKPELTGGGLLRSQGGWTGVKALRSSGDYEKGDERILGDGEFVERVLAQTREGAEVSS